MKSSSVRRTVVASICLVVMIAAAAAAARAAVFTTADSGQGKCGHGVQACSPTQVGQPCDPNNLNVICSRQSNGHYCCLAYAP